jgi:hypothetical protein
MIHPMILQARERKQAKALAAPTAEPSRRAAATRRSVGILLYLVVIGFVATATIGVFFGLGLSLLVQPIEKPFAGSSTPNRSTEAAPQSRVAAIPEADVALQSPNPVTETELVVAQWGLGPSLETARKQASQGNGMRGRPLYLWMTLHGTQAAVDRMRTGPPLAIEVRWMREDGNAPTSATGLTIGRPGVADALEQQVRVRGFFEWHSWTWKNALGAGTWTVSLTYPNGRLLRCGQDAQPCRFAINVG